MNEEKSIAQAGELALMVSAQNKRHLIRLEPGQHFQTHRGIIQHDELIGKPWGSQVASHIGSPYILLQPSLADLLLETRRNTQIMYPKDVGYVLLNLDIGPGRQVVEAGSGSGSLTTALAFAVGPTGHVISYDNRPQLQDLARKNVARAGLSDRVTFKTRDIVEGFDEEGADALFLDVPNPYDYVYQVRQALKSGGFFGSILPTTNQVSQLMIALHREKFGFIDACEIMLRYYKPAPLRLRPTDRMVAHTGYLVFARPIVDPIAGLILPGEEEADTGLDDDTIPDHPDEES